MLRAGNDIREWVQDGIDFYKALEVAKNAPVWVEDRITDEIPVVTEPVIEPAEEPTSFDDLIIEAH